MSGAEKKWPTEEFLVRLSKDSNYLRLGNKELEDLWIAVNNFVTESWLRSSPDVWLQILELHFHVSLLTCRDQSAKLSLQRIIDRVGLESRRVYALRTEFVRATLDKEKIETHLSRIPEDCIDAKKIGLVGLKVGQKWKAYTEALIAMADADPCDIETWAELAETYAQTGNYEDAVRCWQQVLVIQPFAYNAFSRIGELQHLQATSLQGGIKAAKTQIASALSHFCRAVELCPTYIRGWAGIFVVASKLKQLSPDGGDLEKLETKARTKLQQLAKDGSGFEGDAAAAEKLLRS